MTRPILRLTLCFAVFVWFAISPSAWAGEVNLSWNPSETAQGYRVHRGTTSGDYSSASDEGNSTSTPIEGLQDCVTWYFSVTAYNTAGESGFSSEISSFPRAVVSGVAPAALEQGTQADVAVTGLNFRPGDVVTVSNPGVQIDAVTVNSCGEILLAVTVASDAAVGAAEITIAHPSGVAGTGAGLLTITAPVPPTVVSTAPLDGATDVSRGVEPTVFFSEPVTGVTSSTLRLVDDANVPVTQAAGSPSVSADGTSATITPAAQLDYATTYRIHVVGGADGVQDLDGNPLSDDFVQANGFTTESDGTAPVIVDVTVADVTGTTAVVSWGTDEPADSRVFFRKQGDELYQTAGHDELVTEHSVTLTGLWPETTYEFHVGSTNAAGKTANSSPDETLTTGSSPYDYLRFEAESGLLDDPLDPGSGTNAFAGRWVETPAGSSPGTPGNPLGTVTHGVYLPEAGTWYVWVRVYGGDAASDAWYESIDGAEFEPITADVHGEWTWVAGRAYDLAEGQHLVRLGGFDPGARADRLLLTDDPDFLPTEAPDSDVTPPEAVGDLVAEGGAGEIQLSWTNPADADLERVVVRVRGDGVFPTSPADGTPLAEATATPGAAGSFLHGEVPSGVTYHYAVFAVDASGNVSPAGQAVGTTMSVPAAPTGITVF